jgi:hypothetical protein
MSVAARKKTSGALSLLRLFVVAGAGIGGWFGQEQLIRAHDTAQVEQAKAEEVARASLRPQAPWPADLVVAETTWTGQTRTTFENSQGVLQILDTDPVSGRTHAEWATSDGEVTVDIEIDVDEMFVDRNDGAGFVAEPAGSASGLSRRLYSGSQPTLAEVFPSTTWAFTELVSEARGPSAAEPTRILTFRTNVQQFVIDKPAQAAQWLRSDYGPDVVDTAEVSVELDAVGQIVNISEVTGYSVRFEQLDVAPTFSSPLTP